MDANVYVTLNENGAWYEYCGNYWWRSVAAFACNFNPGYIQPNCYTHVKTVSIIVVANTFPLLLPSRRLTKCLWSIFAQNHQTGGMSTNPCCSRCARVRAAFRQENMITHIPTQIPNLMQDRRRRARESFCLHEFAHRVYKTQIRQSSDSRARARVFRVGRTPNLMRIYSARVSLCRQSRQQQRRSFCRCPHRNAKPTVNGFFLILDGISEMFAVYI